MQTLVISAMEWVPFYAIGLIGCPVSMLAWEHRNFDGGPKFRLEWLGKRIVCKWFDGIINITKKDMNLYRDYSRKAKLYQIYNVCGVSSGCDSEYDSESKRIISVGYLSHVKGFDMLIDVAAKVLPKHKNWIWDIYGEGDARRELQEKIDKCFLDNQLCLMGCHDNLGSIIFSVWSGEAWSENISLEVA